MSRKLSTYSRKARRSLKVSHFSFTLVVYFLVKGTAAYVLPRFDNKIYRLIVSGEHFGHVDFAISEEMVKFDISKTKRLRRKNMVRRFTL